MRGHVARTEEMTRTYTIFVEKSEGKRPVGRPRHRWEDKIKLILGKCGWRV